VLSLHLLFRKLFIGKLLAILLFDFVHRCPSYVNNWTFLTSWDNHCSNYFLIWYDTNILDMPKMWQHEKLQLKNYKFYRIIMIITPDMIIKLQNGSGHLLLKISRLTCTELNSYITQNRIKAKHAIFSLILNTSRCNGPCTCQRFFPLYNCMVLVKGTISNAKTP
jgi:hypothetical protein